MATSLIKDVAKKAKSNAVKSIGNAVMGSGVVGGALNKAFQKKFGDKEEKDTRVADALEQQTKAQDDNSATLTRIESIVMNIADNVYNLAGIMNAQVVSMQEAERLQKERAFAEAAAKEENAAEALKPSTGPAGTAPPAKEKEGKGIMGVLSSIMDSVGSTKKMFKMFTKKFGVLALGITAAVGIGAAGAAVAKTGFFDSKDQKQSNEETPAPQDVPKAPEEGATPQQATPQTAPGPAGTEAAAKPESSPATTAAAPAPTPSAGTPETTTTNTKTSSNVSLDIKGAPPPPAPVISAPPPAPGAGKAAASPAAPPPQPAATQITKDTEAEGLKEYFERPENAMDKVQLEALWARKQQLQTGLALAKQNNDPKLTSSIVDNISFVETTRSAILERGKKANTTKSAPPAGASPASTPMAAGGGGATAVSAPPVSGSKFGDKAESDPKEARDFIFRSSQIGVNPKADGSFIDIESGNPVTEEQLAQKIQATGKDPAKVMKQVKLYQEKIGKRKQTPEGGDRPEAPAGGAGGAAPAAAPGGGGGGGSGGGGGGGAVGGATAVPPKPASGADIATASTDVAAASEPKPPQTSSTEINTGSSDSNPLPSSIPTPIANRGTLDVGTIFGSES